MKRTLILMMLACLMGCSRREAHNWMIVDENGEYATVEYKGGLHRAHFQSEQDCQIWITDWQKQREAFNSQPGKTANWTQEPIERDGLSITFEPIVIAPYEFDRKWKPIRVR